MDTEFGQVLGSIEALRMVYRQPHRSTQAKVVHRIDEMVRGFIGRSPFVLLSTADTEGRCDVSPRGGPVGFVKVLDESHLVLPDLNGNNLLDSLQNIVANGHAGLLFLLPGRDETLRINGSAVVSTDPSLLDLFDGELKRPTSVIGITVSDVYVHCAKSFRRGGVWDPASWPQTADVPSAAAMLTAHIGLNQPAAELEAALEASYAKGLAADRPDQPAAAS